MSEGKTAADAIRELLEQGMVRIIVDATKDGVVVPEQWRGHPRMPLNLSYKFDGHNMRFGQQSLCVTLSFARVPFRCELPWSAIVAAGVLPREVAPATKPTPPKRGHLQLVKA
jgi:hypothetical protein